MALHLMHISSHDLPIFRQIFVLLRVPTYPKSTHGELFFVLLVQGQQPHHKWEIFDYAGESL